MNENRSVFAIIFAFAFFLFSFIKNDTEQPPKDKFVVVLDAGHGGHDPGNLGNGYLEKNIALAIVLETGKILEKNQDIKVVYTRKDDSFVDLFVRGEIANQANADLFVSVHCDSHGSDAYGAGTFVLGLHANKQNFEVAKKENSVIYLEDNYEQKYAEYDINSPESIIGLTIMQEEFLDQSIELAKLLQINFTKKLKRKDRKVKQAGFIVLHQTFMPSVLIETGFLTNKNEGTYLNSDKGRREMGNAIANAILSFKDGVDANLIALETVQEDPPNNVPSEIAKPQEKTSQTPSEKVAVVKKDESNQSEVKSKPESPAVTKVSGGVVFKVQLMASSKSIPLTPNNFNGLNELSSEPVKNMYRYMYGNTNTYKNAQLLQETARTKGYTSAYVVAYRNGQRVALKEALKYSPD